MSIRSAQSITVLFTTRVFATGVATNADSLPTGTLYVNGTADGATVTVTNVTTGLYKAAVTLPTLAYLDVVEIRINATVSSVTDNCAIWRDTKDIAIDSSGRVDLGKWIGGDPLALSSQQVQSIVPDSQKVDLNTIKTQAVAAAAPVTFPASIFAAGGNVNVTQIDGQTVAATAGTITFTGGATVSTLAAGAQMDLVNTPNATAITAIQAGLSTLTQTQVTGGAYALNHASFAFNSGLDFTTTQKAATLARVTLVDTLTTYTGNTVQTGDSFARIGANGAGLTAIQLPSNGLANITAWTVAITGNITGNLSGSVGSVTGAVGSVTGTVTLADGSLTTAKLGTFILAKTTNITGFNDIAATAIVSAGAITTSGGAVTTVTNLTNLTTMPTDWITAAGVSAAAVTKIQTGISIPSAAAVADAVWDEVLSDHLTVGTTGALLSSANDPWSIALPGAYAAGTAGLQFANMNAIVSLLSAYPGDFTVTSPMNSEGDVISLFRGDDFKLADAKQIVLSDSGWSLTGSTVKLLIGSDLTLTGTVTSATACYFEATAAQTKMLTEDAYSFEFKQITAGSNTITLATGVVKMSGQIG